MGNASSIFDGIEVLLDPSELVGILKALRTDMLQESGLQRGVGLKVP